ncbi:hypothetical protein CF392_16135 [Tamilnaduibacter salinus]|uniref:Uncharacterized protein n=1 Tax=Tamilnaduibacter salinus TaxID=1484056 RepID=A0A2A2I0C4_9GAMM|nr:hypothetical protein CF392_16135 [Tamilnaduibacter salinus]
MGASLLKELLMNLLTDPWLPFKRRDGRQEYRPVTAMVDPDVIDLALPRSDFQGAAYQFLIGLLQTTDGTGRHGRVGGVVSSTAL